MGAYRLYFLNDDRRVIAADVFDAPNHPKATEMAVLLADACADECSGFELWQANHRISAQMPLNGGITEKIAGRVSRDIEEAVALREEHIRDSRSRVSASRRLLNRINDWQHVKKPVA